MPAPTPKATIASTLTWWERLLYGTLAIAGAIGAFWLTAIGLIVLVPPFNAACTDRAEPVAIFMLAMGAALVALAWTAVTSLLLAAIRRRGLRLHAGWIVPITAASLALIWGSVTMATTDFGPRGSVPASACSFPALD